MTTRIETVPHTRMGIRHRPPVKCTAENLFGKRFSGLTIEEEYNYNLEYLISQSGPTRWIEKEQTTQNPSQEDTKRKRQQIFEDPCADYSPSRDTHSENYRASLHHTNHFPSNASHDVENIYKHPKPKTVSKLRSSLNKSNTASMPIVHDSSDIDEKMKFTQKILKTNSGTVHIERIKPPLKTVIAARQTPESTYPGLHIYVTESPGQPYYDVVSSFNPSNTKPYGKTVGCNPIAPTCLPYPKPKIVRNSSPTPKRERNDYKSGMQENNPARKSFEQIEPHSVASRVEEFMAMLKPKEEKRSTVNGYAVQETSLMPESRICSPSEVTEYCFTCCKRIYPVDRVSIGERVYHKGCFRCATCQRIVLPGNFASLDGIILCKPHYIEQFRLSGRYELRPFSIKTAKFDQSDSSSSFLER